MSRPALIIIDRNALRANYQLAKSLAPQMHTIAVVKADAYGHGAVEVALTLEQAVDMFAVSCLEEGMELRRAGIHTPVLLLEGCFSQGELQQAIEQNFDLVVHNTTQLQQLENARLNKALNIWLKIDSGMHRLGFEPSLAHGVYNRLKACEQVNKIVLMTHLASADQLDSDYTAMQLVRYQQAIQPILDGADEDIEQSIGNSAALLGWPGTRVNWNRPGIMLYGSSPFEQPHPQADKLSPVMTLKSEVIALHDIAAGEAVGYGNTWYATRPCRIATVAIGYGDGYPRNAKSGTPVLVNGQLAKLAGRVSMDMISVDVSDIDKVNLGDEVILWGRDLSVAEVARWADTVSYELLTRMPTRVSREYVG
jgi:alanine racemase